MLWQLQIHSVRLRLGDLRDCENLIRHRALLHGRQVLGLPVHEQNSDLRSIRRPNLILGILEWAVQFRPWPTSFRST